MTQVEDTESQAKTAEDRAFVTGRCCMLVVAAAMCCAFGALGFYFALRHQKPTIPTPTIPTIPFLPNVVITGPGPETATPARGGIGWDSEAKDWLPIYSWLALGGLRELAPLFASKSVGDQFFNDSYWLSQFAPDRRLAAAPRMLVQPLWNDIDMIEKGGGCGPCSWLSWLHPWACGLHLLHR